MLKQRKEGVLEDLGFREYFFIEIESSKNKYCYLLEIEKKPKQYFLGVVFRNSDFSKLSNKSIIDLLKKIISNNGNYKKKDPKSTKFDMNGKALIMSGILQDITDFITQQNKFIENEKLLNHQSKMATMGGMIKNIAHQWKQPLNVINLSFSSLLLSKTFDTLTDKEFYETKDIISNSVSYMGQTIDDFRDFFSDEKEVSDFTVEHMFEKVFNILDVQLKNYNIVVINNIEDINVTTYENDLVQVIINIINNAKDELIKKNKNDKKFIFISAFKEDDKFNILIKDSAGGIPEDIIHKIFDSYFTTKEKTHGTGIGLFMSKQIIENMNGSIDVSNVEYEYENILHKGAEFRIILSKNDIAYNI